VLVDGERAGYPFSPATRKHHGRLGSFGFGYRRAAVSFADSTTECGDKFPSPNPERRPAIRGRRKNPAARERLSTDKPFRLRRDFSAASGNRFVDENVSKKKRTPKRDDR